MLFRSTRDRTHIPCTAGLILNHWTTREVPFYLLSVRVSKGLFLPRLTESRGSVTSSSQSFLRKHFCICLVSVRISTPPLVTLVSVHGALAPGSLFTFMNWRRKWQPTPVFLPGESQGCGSLVGCSLWGNTESDTTEAT